MCLSILFPQASTTANDLLKLSHGTDHLIQHDQLRHFTIGSGGEKFRRCGDYRPFRGSGDEILQLAFPVCITTGNAHHIVRVLFHHIGIEIHQRYPHSLCGILIGAKYDGLGHAVRTLQIPGDFSGYLLDAVLNDDVVVVIAVGVDPVRDLIAEDIPLSFTGTPAISNIGHDIDDFERGQKAVIDSLFQAVGVNRLSEVVQI